MTLFDAHCHLHDARLDPFRETALAEARAAGILGFACCGTEEADWSAVLALAAREPGVVPFLGLHPWSVATAVPGWLDRLEALLAARPWVGVGEAGLDLGRRDLAPPEEQEAALLAQLHLARRLGRPIALHGVRAWGRLLALLTPLGPQESGLLLHSFSGSAELVGPLADLGAFFSFSGVVTRSAAGRTHAAARAVPADRLLVETDAPDILPILGAEALADAALPRDAASRPVNLPANLRVNLAALAALRGEAEETLGARCHANALRLLAPLLEGRP